jgi:hypothetical protein
MSVAARRGYRKRYTPTTAEQEVLTEYAKEYAEARRNGVARELTREIVERARKVLSEVSDREWNSESKEPYEIRQWFNRWSKAQRRTSSREYGPPSGRESEGEVEVEVEVEVKVDADADAYGDADVDAFTGDPWTTLSMPLDTLPAMHDARGLLWWEDSAEPVFEEDMLGMDYWHDI